MTFVADIGFFAPIVRDGESPPKIKKKKQNKTKKHVIKIEAARCGQEVLE